MDGLRTFRWDVEDIIAAHPGLYTEHWAVMAVAIMSRQGASPYGFLVECDGFSPPQSEGQTQFRMEVAWQGPTAEKADRVWGAEQPKPVIERAALAMAALAFAKLVPGGRMQVTREGERADYWLPVLRCALEVSGTRRGRELNRRHREKVAQVLRNPLRWDGYAFVCCFAPGREQIRWSFHRQGVSGGSQD